MAIVGGLRARLIRESVYQTLLDGLTDLDWFDAGRKHRPITFNSEPVDPQEPVPFNTVALADADIISDEEEMGSLMAEHRRVYYVDFFAESDALGNHLINDIKDYLEGRMSSIGRISPIVDVYNWQEATPSLLFTCQVENVMVDRAVQWIKPHQAHWYSCVFDVTDHYGTEDDD